MPGIKLALSADLVPELSARKCLKNTEKWRMTELVHAPFLSQICCVRWDDIAVATDYL